ncbi:hypothetical protein ABK040_004896 [Willaertia magna]
MIQDKVENNQVESNEKNNVPNEANGLNDNDNNTEFRKEKKPKDPRKVNRIPIDIDTICFNTSLQALPGIQKCIVKEGEGQVATKGSNIRYKSQCKVFFKKSEEDKDLQVAVIEKNLEQERRLRTGSVLPVLLDCIYTMKYGEEAIFKIERSKMLQKGDSILSVDCVSYSEELSNVDSSNNLVTIESNNVKTHKELVNLQVLPEVFYLLYLEITFLEIKEPVKPPSAFDEFIEQCNKERELGNKQYRNKEFKKALTTYRRGLKYISDVEIDNENFFQKEKLVNEHKVKLKLNIAKVFLAEGNFSDCIEQCEELLKKDKYNYEANYLEAKCYLQQKDYERGLLKVEKSKSFLKHDIEVKKKKIPKVDEVKQKLEDVETSLKKLKEEMENKDRIQMKKAMPNLFKESLYDDTVVTEGAIENSMNNLNEEEENYLEDYDEDKWEELQKRDEMLGKKPWFTSDGGVIYLDKN